MTGTGKDTQELSSYLSYLLRLWQTGSVGSKVWWASLESVQSGECLVFASLEVLFEYLRAQTGVESSPDFGSRASARPRFPKSVHEKGGDDANSADSEAADL